LVSAATKTSQGINSASARRQIYNSSENRMSMARIDYSMIVRSKFGEKERVIGLAASR